MSFLLLNCAAITLFGGSEADGQLNHPSAGTINTVVGAGAAVSIGLNSPQGLIFDSSGNLYIADEGNSYVYVVSPPGGITSINDYKLSPFFADTTDVAVDSSGNIYMADPGVYFIDKYTPSSGAFSTVVGDPQPPNYVSGVGGYNGDGISATSAGILAFGVALDAAGNMYIADTYDHRIRKVSAATGLISTVAGNGTPGYNGDGIAATAAELYYPNSVRVDAAGNLYIADTDNNRIRMVTASTGLISTVAGNGTAGFSGDGSAARSAELSSPDAIALDSAGTIYIADYGNNRIRMVTTSTGIITTVAGNGTAGFSGDSGPATSAELSGPGGVAVDSFGNVYIADSGNKRIRVLGDVKNPVFSSSCSPNPITTGSALTCTATVTGIGSSSATGTIAWTVNGNTLATSTLSGGTASITETIDGRFINNYENTIVASYSGDSNNNPASISIPVTVGTGAGGGANSPTLPQWAELGMGGVLMLISIVTMRKKRLGVTQA